MKQQLILEYDEELDKLRLVANKKLEGLAKTTRRQRRRKNGAICPSMDVATPFLRRVFDVASLTTIFDVAFVFAKPLY
jgi:hypothetical protein